MEPLADRILAGDRRAAARLMRDLDDRIPSAAAEMAQLYPHTGKVPWVGVTGNPGSGKSTLVDQLIERYRARGKTVGVVAVDPTSPFSGGAILGDRIRMQRHGLDDGVFVRSLATRGHLGGLSRSTRDVARVFDALGMNEVLIETVGVGQDEVEVSRVAQTCVVVLVPGLGDDIQALKAGVLEIADVFVVNKADRPGVDRVVRELEMLVSLKPRGDEEENMHHREGEEKSNHRDTESRSSEEKRASDRKEATGAGADAGAGAGAEAGGGAEAGAGAGADAGAGGGAWVPPILTTVASDGTGVDALVGAIDAHRAFLSTSDAGQRRREAQREAELREVFRARLVEAAISRLGGEWRALVAAVDAGTLDPYNATEQAVNRLLGG